MQGDVGLGGEEEILLLCFHVTPPVLVLMPGSESVHVHIEVVQTTPTKTIASSAVQPLFNATSKILPGHTA